MFGYFVTEFSYFKDVCLLPVFFLKIFSYFKDVCFLFFFLKIFKLVLTPIALVYN